MKRLLVAATLVTAFALPLASRAEVSAFGVSIPLEQRQVSDNVRGGSIAEYPYYPIEAQRLNNRPLSAPASAERQNVYSVFGVNLSGHDVI